MNTFELNISESGKDVLKNDFVIKLTDRFFRNFYSKQFGHYYVHFKYTPKNKTLKLRSRR